MIDDIQYAVYLHAGALESLGEIVTPYIVQGPSGPHFVCTDIDTGGALCELTVEQVGEDGRKQHIELMLPIAMIKLVMSIGMIGSGFGFRSEVVDPSGEPTQS